MKYLKLSLSVITLIFGSTGINLQQVKSQVNYSNSNATVTELLQSKYCPSCNLQNANLRGASLTGANLEDANLSNVDLSNANLSGELVQFRCGNGLELVPSNLRGANLSGANLENANLKNANLENADLRGANLRGANLEGANLKGASLEGAMGIEQREYLIKRVNVILEKIGNKGNKCGNK
ncbi:pentapeptide repeat-containing protein [Planktothrix sp. FACHB-1355]|uniref:Pentapeptide repeat-containing protein n=2 Tax=Cyanophyceae TaxID=3028117 RepID=A0A926VEX1_9CYAN|nr:pentapeptide repeat-containing protein [Aerosakkonema funiforme FACHB-1375]MBD3561031.1 pentapeptide repeat-containing protein [Planktothrix sp. FACHB-1355]